MAWSGLDQRSFPRVHAKCDIWIQEGADRVIKTRTENVGGGGVCVILKEELEKLSRVHLSLTLRRFASPIHCDGKIVWTVRSTDPASHEVTYDTGIEFLNLKTEDGEAILTFTEGLMR